MGAIAKLASRSALKEFEHDSPARQEKGEIPRDAEILKRTRWRSAPRRLNIAISNQRQQ